jgi:metallo-beta-lactamase family protein
MNLKLAFHGGAGTVTGSRHLLTSGKHKVLVDAGMFQGLKELRLMNWRRPTFDPQALSDVLLTHAHIDHSGYLPKLVREGFHGTIHTTPPTRELVEVLLYDSAKLQEEDAEYANRKGFSKHHPALPLYTSDDVARTMRRMKAINYNKHLTLGDGIDAQYFNAGHILGAAFILVHVESGGHVTRIVFSGDMGRYGVPLHVDPEPLPPCDVLVLESTYGDRLHDPTPFIDEIRAPFREAIARGGTILIPSFALARVQLVTLSLRELMESGDIPDVPVHIDSPMAIAITRIYQRYVNDGELDEDVTPEEWRRLLGVGVQFHETAAESKEINALKGPRIIVASSGMLTGGRVLHHLERLLPDDKNLIVLAGFQAPGTRGRALEDGAASIRMHGRDIPVRAQVLSLHGMSAHADANELIRWVGSGTSLPRRVFVTHGEPPAAAAIATRLEAEFNLQATVPQFQQEFDLSHP